MAENGIYVSGMQLDKSDEIETFLPWRCLFVEFSHCSVYHGSLLLFP